MFSIRSLSILTTSAQLLSLVQFLDLSSIFPESPWDLVPHCQLGYCELWNTGVEASALVLVGCINPPWYCLSWEQVVGILCGTSYFSTRWYLRARQARW
jgi:hypothetical protein